jgi:hypothetical protein
MTYEVVQRSLRVVLGVVALSGTAAFADPAPTSGNPDTNASDKNFDANQPNTIGGGMQKTEDGANRAMNKVDRGVHKVAKGSRKAGKKAKEGTKEAASDVKEGTKEAAQDVKDNVNDKVEPDYPSKQ